MLENKESGYKSSIIMLKDDKYALYPVRKMTNRHDDDIRNGYTNLMKKD